MCGASQTKQRQSTKKKQKTNNPNKIINWWKLNF